MALPPLATVSDLAAWLGQAIPDEDPRAGAVLSHASSKVRSFCGKTWDDGQIPDVVAQVTVRLASRAWSNPDEADSATMDGDTLRYGSRFDLTPADKADLADHRSDDAKSAGPLGIVSTYRDEPADSGLYVPSAPAPSGQPFPWA